MMHHSDDDAGPAQGPAEAAEGSAPGRELAADGIRITALGGLGEIGMNCLLLEQRGAHGPERMLVDCGALFRDGDWGVDMYGPRLDALLDAPDALAGVALTHGHEDHIGALWTLALALGPRRSAPLEVVGPPYAIALCRRRLDEYPHLQRYLNLRVNEVGDRFRLGGSGEGGFGVESIRMTHSTVDSSALAIDTAAGRVVHSGDFKLDPTPRDGQCSDSARLAQLGDEGVRLLLADSTNVLGGGRTRSEAVPAAALLRLVGRARQRVVVGLFASNVERLDSAAAAALAHGRRLCLLGRSLRTHVEVSHQLGRLKWPSDLLIQPQQASSLERHKVLYLATGTQGEPRAALRRIASGKHHRLRLERGDTVLMSCRTIPGLEQAVVTMINELERHGAAVIGRLQEPDLHVSGHARQDELKQLLAWTRPQTFIPLHGTSAHLSAHAALARAQGVPLVRELRNGDSALLDGRGLRVKEGPWASMEAYRAGRTLGKATLRQRRRLGCDGLLMVALGGPSPDALRLKAVGLELAAEELEELQGYARQQRAALLGRADEAEQMRLITRRWLTKRLGYKPLVEVLSATAAPQVA